MQSREINGVRVSVLSLGTVQLGLNYGISNTTGKPDLEQSFSILDAAMEEGISVLDTAAAYGDSEQVIGAWLASRFPGGAAERAASGGVAQKGSGQMPYIVTKAVNVPFGSAQICYDGLRRSAETSMQRLGIPRIPLLMMHHFENYLSDPENMKAAFMRLKEEGLIGAWGLSAYAHHDYFALARSGCDAVQIPLNLLDQRQIESGGLQALQNAGIMVFARSVYLQGLIFRDPDALEQRMIFCIEPLTRLRQLCSEFEMTPAQLALSFVLGVPGVASLVLGSETPQQVRQNAQMIRDLPVLDESQMRKIRETFRATDPRVLNPSEW